MKISSLRHLRGSIQPLEHATPLRVRLANTTDIPLLRKCNHRNLPEKYSDEYFHRQLSVFPELSFIIEDLSISHPYFENEIFDHSTKPKAGDTPAVIGYLLGKVVDVPRFRVDSDDTLEPFSDIAYQREYPTLSSKLDRPNPKRSAFSDSLNSLAISIPDSIYVDSDVCDVDSAGRVLEDHLFTSHVVSVAVENRYRGRGLGEALLTLMHSKANQVFGLSRATLLCRTSNTPALALYRSLGYRIIGIRRNYYEPLPPPSSSPSSPSTYPSSYPSSSVSGGWKEDGVLMMRKERRLEQIEEVEGKGKEMLLNEWRRWEG